MPEAETPRQLAPARRALHLCLTNQDNIEGIAYMSQLDGGPTSRQRNLAAYFVKVIDWECVGGITLKIAATADKPD